MTTTDEMIARSVLRENAKLRERIAVLEKRLKPRPQGVAAIAFGEFWEVVAQVKSRRELAQLAFDAGHALRHKQSFNRAQPDSELDSARLDFTLDNLAFICAAGEARFQLMTQDEDEEYRILSAKGDYFATKRAAVDSAMAAQRGEKGGAA